MPHTKKVEEKKKVRGVAGELTQKKISEGGIITPLTIFRQCQELKSGDVYIIHCG